MPGDLAARSRGDPRPAASGRRPFTLAGDLRSSASGRRPFGNLPGDPRSVRADMPGAYIGCPETHAPGLICWHAVEILVPEA